MFFLRVHIISLLNLQMIDKINQRYGTKNILLRVEGVENQKWTAKCEQRTPNYLTDINEIMTIKI